MLGKEFWIGVPWEWSRVLQVGFPVGRSHGEKSEVLKMWSILLMYGLLVYLSICLSQSWKRGDNKNYEAQSFHWDPEWEARADAPTFSCEKGSITQLSVTWFSSITWTLSLPWGLYQLGAELIYILVFFQKYLCPKQRGTCVEDVRIGADTWHCCKALLEELVCMQEDLTLNFLPQFKPTSSTL